MKKTLSSMKNHKSGLSKLEALYISSRKQVEATCFLAQVAKVVGQTSDIALNNKLSSSCSQTSARLYGAIEEATDEV